MSALAHFMTGCILGLALHGGAASAASLALGQTATGVVKSGDTVEYVIAAPAYSYLAVRVSAFGRPLRFALREAGGKAVGEAAPMPNLFGAFELAAISGDAAMYALQISSSSPGDRQGTYEVQLVELAPASERYEEWVRVNDRLNQAAAKLVSVPADDRAVAQAASEIDRACPAAPQPRCLPRARFIKALLYMRANRFDRAAAGLQQAIDSTAAHDDTSLAAAASNELALVWSKLGNFRAGLETAVRSVELAPRVQSRYLTATAHSRLCGMLLHAGQTNDAMKECEAAVAVARASHLMAVSAEAEVRQAQLMAMRGDKRAQQVATSALQVFRSEHVREGEAYALDTLANIRFSLGDFQGALDFANQASPIYDELSDPHGRAGNLRLLGTTYARLGQVKLAESHYEKAAELSRAIKDEAGEAETLLAFGIAKLRRGDSEGGLALYRRALLLSRATSMRLLEAEALRMIGDALRLKDAPAAIASLREALQIYRERHDFAKQGQVLGTLGGIARGQRDYGTALEYYQQALEVKRKGGDRFGIAISQLTIAAVLRSQGKLGEARTTLGEAVRDIEAQRRQVASPNLRMSYFDGVQAFYENYIDLLMEMHHKDPGAGHDREAFQVSESARARVLLDNFPELRDMIPAELAGREREIRDQIEAARNNPKAASADGDLLQAQYERLYDQARSRSPWYSAGHAAQVLTAEEAAQRLLDDRTLLVEYKVCNTRSFVWVIGRKGVYTKELAGRATLRKLVSTLLEAQKLQTIDADEEFWKAGLALSRELIAPIADRLFADRILFVTDDVLQQVPFSGLPWPDGGEPARFTPLVKQFEIVNVPSASAAAAVRASAKPPAKFPKEIAVFADPVFGAGDGRISQTKSKTAIDPSAERVRVRVTGEGAEALRRRIPSEKRGIFTGLNASLEKLKNARLLDYRVVYFATHAEIDADRPEASGIRLSSVDAEGRPQPGMLRILDIYRLKMHPDLVVLSNCNSAQGTNRAGEGLVTFARAFLFAGARRVVATLWPIEAVPAERLTSALFSRLLGAQRLSPSTALRQTQLALWKMGYQPRQWAAFIVIGDWD
jgi:CHAT domain-containing protein